MNGHDEFLELVAASIDFELTDEEFGRLSTHLARCPDCRRAADEIRGGAAAIAALPAPVLAPARAEQILRTALRTPPAKPRWGLLAVAAMLATLGGGILFAGFQLVNDDDSAPSEPPPSLVAEASAPPSAEPAEESADPGSESTDGPPATPNTGEQPTPTPKNPAEIRFPVPYSRDFGFVRVAPAPDDRLWVAFNRDRDTVLALLDGGGAPVDGWPAIVPNANDCLPLAAPDGSVRLLCYYSTEPGECVDVCGEDRAFAFAPNGKQLGGFPVSFPSGFASGVDRYAARMVGDSVVLTGYESSDDEESGPNDRWIVEVRSNGNVVLGARVPAAQQCCVIGPDGSAYGTSVFYPDDADLQQTQVVAFDAHGMRSGWPIVVDGTASPPSFGPNGQLVLSSWADTESRMVRRNSDGSEAAPPIDVPQSITWSPDVDGPLPPLVDEHGRMWATTQEEILGFDQDGAPLEGFPYNPETGLVTRGGDCGEQDTGCQSSVAPPQLAPQSLIYTLENAPAGKGERLNVVNRDGSVRSGWPQTLQRSGARWESVTIGSNRVAYAVASEPEPNDEASVTILAYAPNGTRTWKLTLIEP